MFDIDKSQLPDLLGQPPPSVPSTDGSARARMPGDDPAAAELARLRRRVGQQDHALARLAEALQALRQGGQALRDENRELRRQLEAVQRVRRARELRPSAERCPSS